MPSLSELRIRIGAVEIAVTGTSWEDCLRQLEAACQEVDHQAEACYLITEKGRRALEDGRNRLLDGTWRPAMRRQEGGR
jgi:hypothetical protein